ELRNEKDITQAELAKHLGVKNYVVANWEQRRTSPSLDDLKALADYFECSIDYIVGREDEKGNIIIQGELSEEYANVLNYYKKLPTDKKAIALVLLQDIAKISGV
ncbi:MAG: helix-turn-helix transcriptional regulator, partial [Clostridia bacterium]|nr:helix-turn-helix transcriptional regulator [Clostridia bacterium]